MNKNIMRAVGLGEEVDAVEAGLCPFCKQKILKNSFRDALSEKKFSDFWSLPEVPRRNFQ